MKYRINLKDEAKEIIEVIKIEIRDETRNQMTEWMETVINKLEQGNDEFNGMDIVVLGRVCGVVKKGSDLFDKITKKLSYGEKIE